MDPAGATIGLRPLLLLIGIALCIKLGLYPTFTLLVNSGEVNHIVLQPFCYFVIVCEVTEIAVVTSMSFVLGTDTFIVCH